MIFIRYLLWFIFFIQANIVKVIKLRKLRSEASIWRKLYISIGLLLARFSRELC